MAEGQRKARGVVIEFGAQPTIKRMAGIASRGELSVRVIGIGGLLVVRQMTGRTGC